MLHPAIQLVERYYTLFNDKDWTGIVKLFDLPVTLLAGERKIQMETAEAVTAAYRAFGDKFAQEGAVRLTWDRGSFALFEAHDDFAVVKTILSREKADGTVIKTWSCSYASRVVGSSWVFTLIKSDDGANSKAI